MILAPLSRGWQYGYMKTSIQHALAGGVVAIVAILPGFASAMSYAAPQYGYHHPQQTQYWNPGYTGCGYGYPCQNYQYQQYQDPYAYYPQYQYSSYTYPQDTYSYYTQPNYYYENSYPSYTYTYPQSYSWYDYQQYPYQYQYAGYGSNGYQMPQQNYYYSI